MSDLVGYPEDRFSRVAAQLIFQTSLDLSIFSCENGLSIELHFNNLDCGSHV